MAIFDGKIHGIPGICVDLFCDDDCEIYFLSHAHGYHMDGLLYRENGSRPLIRRRDKQIVVSQETAVILKQAHPQHDWDSIMIKLNLFETKDFTVCGNHVRVTAIPANHCLGSVMFYFETSDEKKILYTGDHRVDVTRLEHLGIQPPIDDLYLDPTFNEKCYSYLPSRERSIEEIIRLSEGKKKIGIKAPTLYGYEMLFKKLFEHYNIPIGVEEKLVSIYNNIPELKGIVGKINDECKFIFFQHNREDSNWAKCDLNINLRVRGWINLDVNSPIFNSNYGTLEVCYATHASFEENRKLMEFMRPKNTYCSK